MDRVFVYIMAVGFLGLSVFCVIRAKAVWSAAAIVSLFLAALLGMSSQEWVRGFFKSEVLTRLLAYGSQLERYTATTETMRQELVDAQQRIEAQQKRLEDLDGLVKNLYARTRTEIYKSGDPRLMVMVEGAGTSCAFVELKETPIPESIRFSQGQQVVPPDAYEVYRNVLIVACGEVAGQVLRELTQNAFYVQYVADPAPKAARVPLTESNGKVLAGKTVLHDAALPFGQRTHWPSGTSPWDK